MALKVASVRETLLLTAAITTSYIETHMWAALYRIPRQRSLTSSSRRPTVELVVRPAEAFRCAASQPVVVEGHVAGALLCIDTGQSVLRYCLGAVEIRGDGQCQDLNTKVRMSFFFRRLGAVQSKVHGPEAGEMRKPLVVRW